MMEKNNKLYLGIDIGGTEVKFGIMDAEGSVISTGKASVSFDGYDTPIIETVKRETILFLQNELGIQEKIAAVGVSATGQIDMERGIVSGAAGHIKNWEGTEIKNELETLLRLPVCVGNDANCAALGEYWIGAARGKRNVIALTIGTGVGGGIIVGGNLLLGARGIAGEVGHIVIKGEGEVCSCGNRGCLERYGSTTALIRNVENKIEKGTIPAFEKQINGKAIFERIEMGKANEELVNTVHQWIGYIADGIVSLVHIFNPDIVLIGGGVSKQEKNFIEPLRTMVLSKIMPSYREGLSIEKAVLGNDAGFAGAIFMCIQNGM